MRSCIGRIRPKQKAAQDTLLSRILRASSAGVTGLMCGASLSPRMRGVLILWPGHLQKLMLALDRVTTQAADVAAKSVSRGARFASIALLLGAIAAWFGGRAGAVEATITSAALRTRVGPKLRGAGCQQGRHQGREGCPQQAANRHTDTGKGTVRGMLTSEQRSRRR
jgi:hypothetical protein